MPTLIGGNKIFSKDYSLTSKKYETIRSDSIGLWQYRSNQSPSLGIALIKPD
jgi:hypothetical protein